MSHWLIVGASRGLGLALVETLARQGERVTGLVQHDATRGLEGSGAAAPRFLKADVRSDAELKMASGALAPDTRFDVIVYNAAVHLEHERSDIEQASAEAALDTLDVNAVGALRAVKYFRRFLANDGALVFISSEAGSIGAAKRSCEYGYCMSKAALNMLAKLLENRERQLGSKVQVSTIHPGWMRTDMGGPTAHISADEAAEAIVATLSTRRAAASDAPLFIDRLGNALDW
jgi:NAD(P)-dependent dehydrogenase (short-subunit alcohol dehydrogenase family)